MAISVSSKYPHLGGNSDSDATFYPVLYDHIIAKYPHRWLLDIGCGKGRTAQYFASKGVMVTALDGLQENLDVIKGENIFLVRHDFTTGIPEDLCAGPDFHIGWCCEVVEHIEEKYLPNLLAVFGKCRALFMTHALPGQCGYHHVNCQPREYWIDKLAGIGFTLDQAGTDECLALSHGFFKATGMRFTR
jgi:SAM-dependent methyltransferase